MTAGWNNLWSAGSWQFLPLDRRLRLRQPLHPANRLDIRALVHEIREKFPTKTIWLYTGYLWEQISHFEVMQYVDVCVDGEYEKDKRNVQLHWKGSSNQRVIDVPKSLETGKVCLYCE